MVGLVAEPADLALIRFSNDQFENRISKPARRLSEAEIRIA
jgi:hypothetical protein